MHLFWFVLGGNHKGLFKGLKAEDLNGHELFDSVEYNDVGNAFDIFVRDSHEIAALVGGATDFAGNSADAGDLAIGGDRSGAGKLVVKLAAGEERVHNDRHRGSGGRAV